MTRALAGAGLDHDVDPALAERLGDVGDQRDAQFVGSGFFGNPDLHTPARAPGRPGSLPKLAETAICPAGEDR